MVQSIHARARVRFGVPCVQGRVAKKNPLCFAKFFGVNKRRFVLADISSCFQSNFHWRASENRLMLY